MDTNELHFNELESNLKVWLHAEMGKNEFQFSELEPKLNEQLQVKMAKNALSELESNLYEWPQA